MVRPMSTGSEVPRAAATPPVREALLCWATVMLGLAALAVLGRVVPFVGSLVGAAAVAAFLYAPIPLLERRGQDAHDAGWRFDRLKTDLAWGLGTCLVVLPVFAVAFSAFVAVLPKLPVALRGLLAPYVGAAHPLRWPRFHGGGLDLLGRIAGNAAVAASEEFFYRGYITLRLEERWPPTRRILGAPMGGAAVLATALFAAGHLLEPAPWRLAVFFPALLFAWLRARTGTVIGAALCHWICNVTLLLLELAAFG
jgi:membrane protease YdiL (CAAX protease family)